jgi:hypothetical protein
VPQRATVGRAGVADAAAVGEAAGAGAAEFGDRGAREGNGVGRPTVRGEGERVGAGQRVLARPLTAEGARVGEAPLDLQAASADLHPGHRRGFGGGEVKVVAARAEGQGGGAAHGRLRSRQAGSSGRREAAAEGRVGAVVKGEPRNRRAPLARDEERAGSSREPRRAFQRPFRRRRASPRHRGPVRDAAGEPEAPVTPDREGGDGVAVEFGRVEVTAVRRDRQCRDAAQLAVGRTRAPGSRADA